MGIQSLYTSLADLYARYSTYESCYLYRNGRAGGSHRTWNMQKGLKDYAPATNSLQLDRHQMWYCFVTHSLAKPR